LGTLILIWPSLAASPVDIQSAQGIFSILGGWGGVVIGYYFGRLPAEKAAAEKIKLNTLADTAKTLSESDGELADLQKKIEEYKKLIESLLK
jgi:hypothetical protein